MVPPDVGQVARALITASAARDHEAMDAAMCDLSSENLMALVGALTSVATNLLSLVAQMWEIDSSGAWATITQIERELACDDV